jgi:hypothetical protein
MIVATTAEKHRPMAKPHFPTRRRITFPTRLPRKRIANFRDFDEGPEMALQELIDRIARGGRIRGRCL